MIWQSQWISFEIISAAFLININKKSELIKVLNSKIIIHVCNEIIRFYFFQSISKSYIQIDVSTVFIIEYDFIQMFITKSDKSEKVICFQNVVYCLRFIINLISIYMLRKKYIHFNFEVNLLYERVLADRKLICSIFWINGLSFFQNHSSLI